MSRQPAVFLIGTRWFGVLGPCRRIIEEMEGRGYEVFVFGQRDEHWPRYFNGKTRLIRIFMRRSYTSFLRDFLDQIKLISYTLRYRPRVIHSFNPKPALMSYFSALCLPRTKFIVGVTGLGNTFIRAKRIEGLISAALRIVGKRADYIFFQNPDDRDLFLGKKIGDESKYRLFIGPGVDLEEFDWQRRERLRGSVPIRVICVARLIWQKGIREYVEAARRVKVSHGSMVEFHLVGDFDRQHPDCVDDEYIQAAVEDGTLIYTSWTDSLPEILTQMDIHVLHSYREGAPRAILEASAMKIPTIGSDAIGVRELVKHGETGLLTELKSVDLLVAAIVKLVEDCEQRESMGEAAYRDVAVPLSLPAASRAQLALYDSDPA